MTQCEKILRHLNEHGTITRREALLDYGIARLAARIRDLRERGHSIRTEMIEVTNHDNSKSRVAKYHLEEDKEVLA